MTRPSGAKRLSASSDQVCARPVDLEHRAELVRVELVRADDPEVAVLLGALHHLAQVGADLVERTGVGRAGPVDRDGHDRRVGQVHRPPHPPADRVGSSMPSRRSPFGTNSRMSEAGLPSISNSSSGLYERSHASTIARWAGFVLRSPAGTWWARNEPSTFLPSTSFGPVQPFGVRSTIIGQAGFSSVAPDAGLPLDPADQLPGLVERGGHLGVDAVVVTRDEQRASSRSRRRASSSSSSLIVPEIVAELIL